LDIFFELIHKLLLIGPMEKRRTFPT